jgi:hypothetical protein
MKHSPGLANIDGIYLHAKLDTSRPSSFKADPNEVHHSDTESLP